MAHGALPHDKHAVTHRRNTWHQCEGVYLFGGDVWVVAEPTTFRAQHSVRHGNLDERGCNHTGVTMQRYCGRGVATKACTHLHLGPCICVCQADGQLPLRVLHLPTTRV